MPLYEYRCEQCSHELEVMQKLADAPLTECPACHQPSLRKLISPVGFRLKGGGWYETDFKSGNKRNLADTGDKPEKAGKAEDSAAKSDKSDKPAKSDSGAKTAKSDGGGKSAAA
jgi:putative FmdB family regulatory protein